jgi:enamine deaminase RidA (YjgF/YER057c/UK114 family)
MISAEKPMSDFRRSRRRFLRECSAGALAITAASYGCNSQEEPQPQPQAPARLPDILESFKPDPESGSSEAVIVKGKYSPLVFTDQFRPRNPAESVNDQFTDVMEQLRDNLKSAGSGWGAMVRMHFYIRTDETAGAIRSVMARIFKEVHKPATTFTRGELEFPDAAFVVDVVSLGGEVELGTESPAVRRSERAIVLPQGALLFVSGEARGNKLDDATRETLDTLESTLRFAECGWDDVAQLKSFVTPMSAVGRVRSVIGDYFAGRPLPMLSFVEWQSKSSPIEIELVAKVPKERADKMAGSVEYLNPPDVAKSPVFSRAAIVKSERLIFTSNLYGDGSDSASRIRDIFGKLRTLAEQSGGSFDHLVKATYYVQDAESSRLLNEIRPEFYNSERPPAASKALVRGVGRTDRKITVDMIAAAK